MRARSDHMIEHNPSRTSLDAALREQQPSEILVNFIVISKQIEDCNTFITECNSSFSTSCRGKSNFAQLALFNVAGIVLSSKASMTL